MGEEQDKIMKEFENAGYDISSRAVAILEKFPNKLEKANEIIQKLKAKRPVVTASIIIRYLIKGEIDYGL